MSTFTKYTLYQVPGWLAAALVLSALTRWIGLPPWLAVALLAAYVAKDFALYPLLRRAYEPARGPLARLIGQTGVAVEPLGPTGYIRVEGELWQAETARGAPSIEAGTRVLVTGMRGGVLEVTPR